MTVKTLFLMPLAAVQLRRPAAQSRVLSVSREYPERPVVGVGGVVVHGGRVLLARRGRPPLLGEWSIPGGALEVGETLVEGVRRELREETGLEVSPVAVLEVLDRIVRDEQGRPQYHYVLIDYLCRVEQAEARAATDVTECCWAARAELPAYELRPDTRRVVEAALDAAARHPAFTGQ